MVFDTIVYLVARQIADPGVVISLQTWSHTFVEIDVSYKQKCVHKVLVNHLVKFAEQKEWLG